jgi:subtilisin family serine protease
VYSKTAMDPLEFVGLPALMALTSGRFNVVIGLVDGPVALDHPELATGHLTTMREKPGACSDATSASCRHGTFVAGVLAARRGSSAPAIAPDCNLLIRPVFSESTQGEEIPSATPRELSAAIVDCVHAGARIVNLSAAVAGRSLGGDHELHDALEYTVRRGVLVIAAAGNQAAVAGSPIVSHPGVIPVIAYGRSGQPLASSNLGRSIGTRGLGGPGEGVVSLAPGGKAAVSAGTSVAAPFVSGAAALLWSLFPDATVADVARALLYPGVARRRTVIPPLLNAWSAYRVLSADRATRTTHTARGVRSRRADRRLRPALLLRPREPNRRHPEPRRRRQEGSGAIPRDGGGTP